MIRSYIFYKDNALNDLEYRALYHLSGAECKILRETPDFRPPSKEEDFLWILHEHGMLQPIYEYALKVQKERINMFMIYLDPGGYFLDKYLIPWFYDLSGCKTYWSIINFLFSRDGMFIVDKYQLKEHTEDHTTISKLNKMTMNLAYCLGIQVILVIFLILSIACIQSMFELRYFEVVSFLITAPIIIITICLIIWSVLRMKKCKPGIIRSYGIEASYYSCTGKEKMFIADINFICAVLEILTWDKAKLMKIKEKHPAEEEYKYHCKHPLV